MKGPTLRLRLLIPAAIAAVATYAALVRDETAPAALRSPPPPPIPRAPATAAHARPDPLRSPYDDLADPAPEPSAAPSVYDLLAGTPPSPAPAVTPPDPDPWAGPIEEGRFALGGFAAAAGHSVVTGVTFRRRLPADPAAERIKLAIDASENVDDPGGLEVLADPGFAPDREGFTLRLTATGPGPFSAAGSYAVLPAA